MSEEAKIVAVSPGRISKRDCIRFFVHRMLGDVHRTLKNAQVQ